MQKEGSTDSLTILNNPWKGLNSYSYGDTLYGRDDELQKLSQFINYNTLTVVYGRSGIGKTSLINAGIMPALEKNGLFPVNLRFDHNEDALDYSSQMIEALRKSLPSTLVDSDSGDETFSSGRIEELVPKIEDDKCAKESLWEFFHRHRFYDADENQIKPLVIIDQFEEIFTLQKNRKKIGPFFSELTDLINGSCPSYIVEANKRKVEALRADAEAQGMTLFDYMSKYESLPKYIKTSDFCIVIVIREDYLASLERNTALIPAMLHNRFSLRPINEEQAAEIITRPIPGLVNEDAVKPIIAKIIGSSDFELDGKPERLVDSAMLSLFMTRLFIKMQQLDRSNISVDLIDDFGDSFIRDFYEESISDVPVNVVEYLETNLLLIDNGKARRDNRYRGQVSADLGDDNQWIEILVDRGVLRDYVTKDEYRDEAVHRIEFVHDLLCPQIKRRRDERELLKVNEEERRMEQEKERMAQKQQLESALRSEKHNVVQLAQKIETLDLEIQRLNSHIDEKDQEILRYKKKIKQIQILSVAVAVVAVVACVVIGIVSKL